MSKYSSQLLENMNKKLSLSDPIRSKSEQFKHIGLTQLEYSSINEILEDAISIKQCEKTWDKVNLWNISNLSSVCYLIPTAVTYKVTTGENYLYNIGSFGRKALQVLVTEPVNSQWIMNNSSNFNYLNKYPDIEIPESTLVTSHDSLADEFASHIKSKKSMPVAGKIELIKRVLEGIADEEQILIAAKPKNRSQKIRKSNRHSKYRGVSLNGRKWQVMIMGPIKKSYFGGIASEREAAIFYDKLSILTNGLAAKTNFNYRKCDLQKIMAELEYIGAMVSN